MTFLEHLTDYPPGRNLLPAGVSQRQCKDPIVLGAYACCDPYMYDRETGELTWLGVG